MYDRQHCSCGHSAAPVPLPCSPLVLPTRDGQPVSTSRVTLNNSKNNFERAEVDVFSFPALVNVGEMKRILIGHDNSGAGAAWHLNKVTLTAACRPFAAVHPTLRCLRAAHACVHTNLCTNTRGDVLGACFATLHPSPHGCTRDRWTS